MHIIAAVGS